MKCEETRDRLVAMQNGWLAEFEQRQLTVHLQSCETCQCTARAVAALQAVREQQEHAPPEGLFDRIMRNGVQPAKRAPAGSRFWLGAGIGGAVAASIMLAVMSLSLVSAPGPLPADIGQFQVSRNEAREFNIAIDLEQDLPGATITVVLTGGIELDGYGNRRDLSWTTDLSAGVNKLTLPILAVNDMGGQLLVRVVHENRQKTFRVELKPNA